MSAPAATVHGMAAEEFARVNLRLQGLAYRMVGSWADAEDIAAETWLRWHTSGGQVVRNPQAWLTTVAVRLSLDRWRTLRRRREDYIGPWLPEPIDTALLPEETADQRQSLRLGLLHLMERLSPDERAVFVLRHAFDYPYAEIATMLGRTSASCRQLAHRARAKIGDVPERPDPQQHRSILERLGRAIMEGRVQDALALVTSDVVLISDGGGRTAAALRPVHGADKVVRFMHGVVTKAAPDAVEETLLNGEPAARVVSGGVVRVFGVDIRDGAVSAVYVLGNPDKLLHLPG